MRAAVVAALVLVAGCGRCGERRDGAARGAWIMPTEDGASLVVVDHLSGKRGGTDRVIAIDVATGRETGFRIFGDASTWRGMGCAPAAPGRMWCQIGRLALHDARTLATIAHAGDLIARSGLGRPAPDRAYVVGADAYIVLDDGRQARIDSATLEVTLDQTTLAQNEWGYPMRGCGTTGMAQVGGSMLRFGPAQGQRSPLVVDDRTTGLDFLQPTILADARDCPGCGGRPMILRQGAAVVRHDSLLDRERAHMLLTAVDARGERLWEVDLGRAACESATLEGDAIVITTTSASSRALAIDATTGAIRWRYRL